MSRAEADRKSSYTVNTQSAPRRRARVPSYRLHKPSGQACLTWFGKLRYLGPHGSPESRAEYNRLMVQWHQAQRRAEPMPPACDLTVGELIVRFLDHAEAVYPSAGKGRGEAANVKHALRPLAQLHHASLVREFGPRELKAVRQAMLDSGSLCRGEINRRVRTILRVFRWGVAEDLVPVSVHQSLTALEGLRKGRTAARESEPVRPVADDQVEAVRTFVSRQVWVMIELQRLTGMRPGEVVLMRAADVDQSDPVWCYTPGHHKTAHHGRERPIFLGPQAQAVLSPWLAERPAGFLFSPSEVMREKRAELRAARRSKVQPSQADRSREAPKRIPGERYTSNSYRHAIRRACLKAGIPVWHPHQLRHAAATRLRREFGLDTARAVLGHASAEVTELYAERDQEAARRAMLRSG